MLVLGAIHNNAYKSAAWDLRGHVFTTTGHIFLGLAIGWLAYVYRRSAAVLLSAALVGAWVLQVAGCNLAWLLWGPWPVTPDGELCSDGLRFPLGTLGLTAAVLVAIRLRAIAKGKP